MRAQLCIMNDVFYGQIQLGIMYPDPLHEEPRCVWYVKDGTRAGWGRKGTRKRKKQTIAKVLLCLTQCSQISLIWELYFLRLPLTSHRKVTSNQLGQTALFRLVCGKNVLK